MKKELALHYKEGEYKKKNIFFSLFSFSLIKNYMFAKSKRFTEEDKDHTPGPGEYEVTLDDSGRHKRYGFLTQSTRFPESACIDISSDFYVVSQNNRQYHNESTATTMTSSSASSTTSSNKTFDDNDDGKQLLMGPENTMHQFERYKYAKQKEIEILQIKTKKLETALEDLETEKNDSKALLKAKDLELAELRSKNLVLQKTVNRQEVASKALQLQKKVEQLEEALVLSESKYKRDVEQKETAIKSLQKELDKSSNTICDLKQGLHENQQKCNSLESQMKMISDQVLQFENSVDQKEKQITELNCTLETMSHTITELTGKVELHKDDIQRLTKLNDDLNKQIETHLKTTTQLEVRLTTKYKEIDTLRNTIDEQKQILSNNSVQIEKLEEKFKLYRNWMEHTVIPYLRQQKKEADQANLTESSSLKDELHEAKKFLNRQAFHMNELKSDIHWLTVQNKQLKILILDICRDHKEQWDLNVEFSNFCFANEVKKNDQRISKQLTSNN
ncbi:MAG: hypothetical protein EXX96DRAFT_554086 [Benjaminiella poitrasii]|nr:MAG: hypothetical protein EXX96DRAFT_554086 [Benjaminiella poitrasii]